MPNQTTPKRQPIYVIGPSIAYIPLTRGLYALVEWEDAAKLCQWNWNAQRNFYAARGRTDGGMMLMHRQILSPPNWLTVDHRNLNRLDNRKHGNLRLATISQNLCNQKKRVSRFPYKGIGLNRHGKWRAIIKINQQQKFLGQFPTAEAAHAAYCAAAHLYHGEFARFE